MTGNMDDIRKAYEGRLPQPIGKHKFFSVLIPLVTVENRVNLLFEVRSRSMESQPGEVCFPGGNMDKGETPLQCALRETHEEIGVSSDKIRLIGPGDVLYGYANYTLFTYMGVIDYADYEKATLNREEVEEVFLIPLEKFEKYPPEVYRENIFTEIDDNFPYEKIGIDESYQWRVGEWDIPIYDIDGRIIWGLTARITKNMVDFLKSKRYFK